MWHGILPAVTTKFTETGELDFREMERFVAVKESSGDLRRTTEAGRMAVFTGVDNFAYEALMVGAVGWIAGLVVAFPPRRSQYIS